MEPTMKARKRVKLMVKVSALVLTIAMTLDGTGVTQEVISVPEDFPKQLLDEKAVKAKAEVSKRGVGKKSKVRVKMRDKHGLTGRIIQIDECSFQLRVEPTFLDDMEPSKGTVLRIPYSEVEKIRGARSRPANTALSVAAVAGLVALLAGILILRAKRCSRSYCEP